MRQLLACSLALRLSAWITQCQKQCTNFARRARCDVHRRRSRQHSGERPPYASSSHASPSHLQLGPPVQGALDMVHIVDAAGNTFVTRITNVFVIGKGAKALVSLPKGRGVRKSILQEQAQLLRQEDP